MQIPYSVITSSGNNFVKILNKPESEIGLDNRNKPVKPVYTMLPYSEITVTGNHFFHVPNHPQIFKPARQYPVRYQLPPQNF